MKKDTANGVLKKIPKRMGHSDEQMSKYIIET